MKIGVLTSSRADFGIYLPLLQQIKRDSGFDLEIVAFGTHMSRFHGYTISEIEKEEFKSVHKINCMLSSDDEASIATSFGLTALKFSDFWSENKYDLVLCLGDRYEMAAAVQAGIPFGIRFAHFHGGETTLGAIDNTYRHQITLASDVHFPATKEFGRKIAELRGSETNIFVVGSLSLSNLSDMPIPDEASFRKKYNICEQFALLTFHPETVSPELNVVYAENMYKSLKEISKRIFLVVTMPNADTFGSIYRDRLLKLNSEAPERTMLIENFGKLNYFAAMKYCRILIGNTSSGIIEAASFGKYVVNVGRRQEGRAQSANIQNCDFSEEEIERCTMKALELGDFKGENIYQQPETVTRVIEILKQIA
jgi:GDP/UDP-N,N'-diacetylbacillosamine 2-epimerase (hydrolysing)